MNDADVRHGNDNGNGNDNDDENLDGDSVHEVLHAGVRDVFAPAPAASTNSSRTGRAIGSRPRSPQTDER